jgi:hypothetical protein
MTRLRCWLFAALLAGCGQTGNTTAPYLLTTSVVDPIDPFVIKLTWEPSAGLVDQYVIEARGAGGSFVDVLSVAPTLGQASVSQIDLKQVVPGPGRRAGA